MLAQWCQIQMDEKRRLKLTIIVIVTHHNLLDLAVLAHLAPEILVESVKMVLDLARIHLVLGVVCRVLVEIRQENCLRVGRLDMLARASIPVATGSDFVVEGAVDLVLLGTEDGSEVVSHGEIAVRSVYVRKMPIWRNCI
jgi:hypothetical protein